MNRPEDLPGEYRSPAETAICEIASDWIIKRDRGLSPEEEIEFQHWQLADERHRAWVKKLAANWEAFGQLADEAAIVRTVTPAVPVGRRLWRPVTLVSLAAACIALAFTLWPDKASIVASHYERIVQEDGSILELNTGSEVRVHYAAAVREVELLRGEANFTVAKDPARPFIVRAGALSVRAVGTVFNVRLATSAVEVLVTEGRVSLAPSEFASEAPVSLVNAGQQAVVLSDAASPQPRIASVSSEEIRRLLAWQPKLLDFQSTPLHEVIAIFNRHSRVPLVLADPELGEVLIVASVRSDNLDGFLRFLEQTVGVRVERSTASVILRKVRS